MRLPACLALASVVLAGCATTPYSLLSGERYHVTPLDTYRVRIVSVDGVDHIRQPVQVEPGQHRVTVVADPVGGFRFGAKETVTLDVQPCTRYHLVAVKPNRLLQDYTVKVDHEEPVPGCVRP